MMVTVDGRELVLPDGAEVTVTIRFPGGQGLSVHPKTRDRTAEVTTLAGATRRVLETNGRIVPGETPRPLRPGIGRKVCPKCHELCGASLPRCPGVHCTHVFTSRGKHT